MNLPTNVKHDIEQCIKENPHMYPNANLSSYTADELWDMYLTWNGIIGYSSQLSEALDSIRKFKEKS